MESPSADDRDHMHDACMISLLGAAAFAAAAESTAAIRKARAVGHLW